jgi:hypothetical protein
MIEKDPNGVAAAVSVLVFVIAGAVGVTVDEGTVDAAAGLVAALVSAASIVVARMKAWAPDTVAALRPDDISAEPVLPAVPAAFRVEQATKARRGD